MMFSCKDLSETVTDAAEGQLTGARRFFYRFHLLVCPGCKAYVRSYDDTLRALRESPPSVAPASVRAAALAAFRARRDASR